MQLKFECQPDCGKCCISHGEYSHVFLTENDILRLEKRLGLPRESFTEKHDNHIVLKSNKDRCMFLKGKLCSVHEDKPIQCSSFPFWKENMNEKTWQELKTFCPGIDVGQEYDCQRCGKPSKLDHCYECDKWHQDELVYKEYEKVFKDGDDDYGEKEEH